MCEDTGGVNAGYLSEAALALQDYRPHEEPLALYRRVQRRVAPFGLGVVGDEPEVLSEAQRWGESLRRDLANHGKPRRSLLEVRCPARDRLAWVVSSPWGPTAVTVTAVEQEDEPPDMGPVRLRAGVDEVLVDVARRGERPQARWVHRYHGHQTADGTPVPLSSYPSAAPPLLASCECYGEVLLPVPLLRSWLRSGPKHVTYPRGPRSL